MAPFVWLQLSDFPAISADCPGLIEIEEIAAGS
jgi:hypothetical protein